MARKIMQDVIVNIFGKLGCAGIQGKGFPGRQITSKKGAL